jgi:hypothetical protein
MAGECGPTRRADDGAARITIARERDMKASRFLTGALVCALSLAAILPASAAVTEAGRAVAPSADIIAFFQARGVDPQYLTKSKSEMPAAQWNLINKIVAAPDDTTVTTDDHDVLNSLVGMSLYDATTRLVGDQVYMNIGNMVWSVVINAADTDDPVDSD